MCCHSDTSNATLRPPGSLPEEALKSFTKAEVVKPHYRNTEVQVKIKKKSRFKQSKSTDGLSAKCKILTDK